MGEFSYRNKKIFGENVCWEDFLSVQIKRIYGMFGKIG
jgi:hypothetical protein